MAHKPKSFKLIQKTKTIIIYSNVEAPEEKELREFYLNKGYSPMSEEKKPATTVEKMREELSDFPEVLAKFNEAYAVKAKKGDKKTSGFFNACRIYQEWAKNNKKK